MFCATARSAGSSEASGSGAEVCCSITVAAGAGLFKIAAAAFPCTSSAGSTAAVSAVAGLTLACAISSNNWSVGSVRGVTAFFAMLTSGAARMRARAVPARMR